MALHPLAYRILGSLGLGAIAVPGALACGSDLDDCPETTTSVVEPIAGCKIRLSSVEELHEFCASVPLIDGQCPPLDDPAVGASEEADFTDVVCGPVSPEPSPGGGGSGGGPGAGPGGGDAVVVGTTAVSVGQGGGGGGSSGVGGSGVGGSGGGGGGGGGVGGGGADAAGPRGECCYVGVERGGCGGRPFYVGGELRTADVIARSDWCDPLAKLEGSLDPAARRALAAAWLGDAALEHASVASFARFSLELLAVGAPPDLLVETQRAMFDEIQHAKACYGLASRYAGEPLGPAPLSLEGAAPETSLLEVVRSTVREGCIGETVAALAAARALEGATDPAVREVLAAIAEEEARHAELAWRVVAWAVRRGGQPVREIVESTIDAALAQLAPPSLSEEAPGDVPFETLRAHGRLSRREERAAIVDALQLVVRPCAGAVFAGARGSSTASDPHPVLRVG